ncbi:MAG TPA: hypothetical protein VFB84_17175 [Micromonosporaceae bacterium]|nr:hypothetical protein [Micromonosporaceae bacterium]
MRVTRAGTDLAITALAYRLVLDPRRAVAAVYGADDRLWFRLRLLASLDTLAGPDETLRVEPVSHQVDLHLDRVRIEMACASSRWRQRTTIVECHEDRLEVTAEVYGDGRILTAHLLGGWRPPYGFLPSGSALRTVFSPNPDHPRRIARPAVEPATIGVVGDGGEPGVGRWLFAPAPWCFAVSRDPPSPAGDRRRDPPGAGGDLPGGQWAGVGLLAPVREQTFTALHYTGGTDGFSLRLDYEGHTRVAGRFRAPTVVVLFGQADPYAVLRRHRELLVERRAVPAASTGPARQPPAYWRQPIFCGWGAQCHLAAVTGRCAQDLATQQHYDQFLAALAQHGVLPGTVVIDDKWQLEYATCRPDPAKWPDLRGWVARRHEQGQRVLLWWKAWDVAGAPASACVRMPDGTPVALDPQADACRRLVEDAVGYMLGARGLDADGLKVDFIARTPSGVALEHAGDSWGADLLHRLLELVYASAKRTKPDALVITHTPNPAFVDVTDMVRLNDVRMLDAPDPDGPVVRQMAYRAEVVRAACGELLVDTDGWCLPDRAAWAEYLAHQPMLGVPALYYATHIDHSGEALRPSDLAAVAKVWQHYRQAHGLSTPRRAPQ